MNAKGCWSLPGDPRALAEALARLLDDAALRRRLAVAARAKIEAGVRRRVRSEQAVRVVRSCSRPRLIRPSVRARSGSGQGPRCTPPAPAHGAGERLHPARRRRRRVAGPDAGASLLRLGQQVAVVTPLLAARTRRSPPSAARGSRSGASVTAACRLGAAVMCLRFAAFLLGHGRRYDAWHVHIGHHLGAVDLSRRRARRQAGGGEDLRLVGAGAGVLAPARGLLDRLARRWLKRATAVQAIGTRIAAELTRQGFPAERIVVLPNAVDTTRFRCARPAASAGAPFTACSSAGWCRRRTATLLDAWAQAFPPGDASRCPAAAGRRRPARGAAAGAGGGGWDSREQVEFLGHRDRVEEVLAEAHVGVLPSRIEGLSNTLLEFMASGAADAGQPGERQRRLRGARAQRLAVRGLRTCRRWRRPCARRRRFRPKGWRRWGGRPAPTWRRPPRSTSWWGDCGRSTPAPAARDLSLETQSSLAGAPPYVDN